MRGRNNYNGESASLHSWHFISFLHGSSFFSPLLQIAVAMTDTTIMVIEVLITKINAAAEAVVEVAAVMKSDERARACRNCHLRVSFFLKFLVLNLFKISSFTERDAGRPKLKLAPRTIKDPVNGIAETKQAAAIFGAAKPREEPTGSGKSEGGPPSETESS